MPEHQSLPADYSQILEEIKTRVQASQYEALKAVNRELISLYWDIGRIIVERQDREGWGRSVVHRLASDLQESFTGITGFSASNLWRIRNFYRTYAENENLAPLVREIR